MDIAQLVRLPTKTREVMGSTPYNPSWRNVYDIILPLRLPPNTRGQLMRVSMWRPKEGNLSIRPSIEVLVDASVSRGSGEPHIPP